MPRHLAHTLTAIAAAAAILACGGDSTAPSEALASVSVTPRDAVLFVGVLWPHMHRIAVSQRGVEIKGTGTWSSSDASIVAVDRTTGAITGVATGSADVQASVTVDGVTKSGTSHVTVVDSTSSGQVTASSALLFAPQLVTVVAAGSAATISWTFQNVAHTVTWDSQPSGAVVADIPSTANASASRDFTVAGEYTYHCDIHPDMTGSILV